MSGAGRSTAAKSLEDLGWFVVDNLPPALLPTMLDLADRASLAGIAAIVDVRSRAFSTDLKSAISSLGARGVAPHVLFLEASDAALVQRFENVRRPHPMQGSGTILDGINAERELLRAVRGDSDIVLDTSALNVHELRARMHGYFGGDSVTGLRLNIVSFGYKYGLPVDADLVADCRFLPNPHWVPELRPLSGLDASVREYVLGQPAASAFIAAYLQVLDVSLPGFEREGKRYVTLAVGCTGGKHRSVAIAEQLAARADRPRRERLAPRPRAGVNRLTVPSAGGRPPSPCTQQPKVVAFGGGHGLAASLSALRRVTDRVTAIVTVADDGGSSGRLRQEFGVLPPGDLRMALAALCGDDDWGTTWARVVQHRFGGDGDLARPLPGQPAHRRAVGPARRSRRRASTGWRGCCGSPGGCCRWRRCRWTSSRSWKESTRPLPAAVSTVRGQAAVAVTPGRVRSISLVPADPPAVPEAVAAVLDADWVVFGPGSWFTSVLPHLLVPSLRSAADHDGGA